MERGFEAVSRPVFSGRLTVFFGWLTGFPGRLTVGRRSRAAMKAARPPQGEGAPPKNSAC